jgi:hypothetical protein
MTGKNKAMITGAVGVVLLLVFVPSAYVWVASKLGKAAEVQKVAT